MIKVQKLFKSFEENLVLKGIDLDVHDNETLVILGPSGQGKTILIKTLVRLILPDSGSIFYDDLDILKLSNSRLVKFQDQIAFVFQSSALFDFLTVYENLSLFPRMHKHLTAKQILDQVLDAINFVGLEKDVLEKYPEELSGGMKKRVAIARAMIKQPRYIFYDEPSTGLDQSNAEKVTELIQMLKAQLTTTSIIVTHDIKLMRDVSDRVALLKDGSIFFVGKKDEISKETLNYLYEMRGNNDV
jgi:phospholipid/cholesterol/gamma-HCH transport system ATP-binding protein